MDETMQKLLELHGSYSTICRKVSIQCCHCCERLYCGDNLNPINPYLTIHGIKRLERFCLMTVGEAEEIHSKDPTLLKILFNVESPSKLPENIQDKDIPRYFVSRLKWYKETDYE